MSVLSDKRFQRSGPEIRIQKLAHFRHLANVCPVGQTLPAFRAGNSHLKISAFPSLG
jgi:hypothetical protein